MLKKRLASHAPLSFGPKAKFKPCKAEMPKSRIPSGVCAARPLIGYSKGRAIHQNGSRQVLATHATVEPNSYGGYYHVKTPIEIVK